MSVSSSDLVAWIDRRLDDLIAAPRMWGSAEAVEMQVLLLVELRCFALLEEPSLAEPRHVFDSYLRFLHTRFPDAPVQPLFLHVGGSDVAALVEELSRFRAQLREQRPRLEDPGGGAIADETTEPDSNVVQLNAELRAATEARRRRLEPVVREQPALARELRHQDEAVRHATEPSPKALAR